MKILTGVRVTQVFALFGFFVLVLSTFLTGKADLFSPMQISLGNYHKSCVVRNGYIDSVWLNFRIKKKKGEKMREK